MSVGLHTRECKECEGRGPGGCIRMRSAEWGRCDGARRVLIAVGGTRWGMVLPLPAASRKARWACRGNALLQAARPCSSSCPLMGLKHGHRSQSDWPGMSSRRRHGHRSLSGVSLVGRAPRDCGASATRCVLPPAPRLWGARREVALRSGATLRDGSRPMPTAHAKRPVVPSSCHWSLPGW